MLVSNCTCSAYGASIWFICEFPAIRSRFVGLLIKNHSILGLFFAAPFFWNPPVMRTATKWLLWLRSALGPQVGSWARLLRDPWDKKYVPVGLHWSFHSGSEPKKTDIKPCSRER